MSLRLAQATLVTAAAVAAVAGVRRQARRVVAAAVAVVEADVGVATDVVQRATAKRLMLLLRRLTLLLAL